MINLYKFHLIFEGLKYLDTGELYFTITYDHCKEVKYDGEALDENDVIKE